MILSYRSIMFMASLVIHAIPVQSNALEVPINVQFYDTEFSLGYSGEAVVGNDGDFWNPFFSIEFDDIELFDSAFKSTGITFTSMIFDENTEIFGGSTSFSAPLSNLMSGYASSFAGLADANFFEFNGLDDGTLYEFYFLTQGDLGESGRRLGVALDSAPGSPLISDPSDPNETTFIAGQNYLKFSNVSPTGGKVSFHWWSVAIEANINGIQIVPEPGGLVLGAMSAVCVLGLNRRRVSAFMRP